MCSTSGLLHSIVSSMSQTSRRHGAARLRYGRPPSEPLLQPEAPTIETPATPVPEEEPTITPVEDVPLKKQPSLHRKKSVHTIPVQYTEEFEARRSAKKTAVDSDTREGEEDEEDQRAK